MQLKFVAGKRSGRVDCVLLAAAAVAASVSSAWGQATSLPTFNSNNDFNVTQTYAGYTGTQASAGGSAASNATALQDYINYVSSLSGGGTVEIPAGTFTSNEITMKSNVNLQLDSGAVLADSSYANTLIDTSGSSSNMEISGSGIINGEATTSKGSNKLVDLQNVTKLEVSGVAVENAGQEHLVTENCSNVTINNVTISDPGTLAANGGSYLGNTDGIDFSGSNYTIENSYVSDGDDDIVAKTAGANTSNVLITNDSIGAGHGISIGGGTTDGGNKMIVSNITFNGTSYGIHLKAQDANTSDGGGGTLHPIGNVIYSNIVMNNVNDPILLDDFYSSSGDNAPDSPTDTKYYPASPTAVDTTTPMWENFGFNNFTIMGTVSNAGQFFGLNTTPVNLEGLSFNNSNLTFSSTKTMDLWYGANINLSGLTLTKATLNEADLSNVTAPGAVSITWNNTGSTIAGSSLGDGATWDTVANENWNNGTGITTYTDKSNVTFNDSNNGHYNVTLNSTVSPLSTTINSSGNYAISGTGTIAGTGSLTKSGTSTAVISTSNAYTGGTIINGGTLSLGSATALGGLGTTGIGTGAKPGGTTVNSTGTLDLAGQALTEPITLNGGTLTNSSGTAASVVGGVKGVGYSTTGGISASSTITFSSGSAAVTPVFGITASSFSGFSGTYPTPTGSTPPPQAPNVVITPSDGNGSGALAIAVMSGTTLTGITIINPGSGYDAAPIITFVGGNSSASGAVVGSATGNANNFTIVGMNTTATGSGYTSAPTATLVNNGGSGTATLTSVIGSLTLQSTSSIGGNGGNINLALPITGAGGFTKIGSNTVTLSGVNSYGGGTTVNGGTLQIQPTTTANTVALPDGNVSIGATGTLQLADNASASTPGSSTNQLMQMSSLSIIPGGVLDVRNNHFFVADPGGAPDDSTFTTILGYIESGAITSTEGTSGYGVGVVDGNDGVQGTAVSANQVEVAYTLDGDANLDGKVDGSDFSIFAPNFGLPTTLGWEAGDFNYDGKVDGSDFSAFAPNFGLQDSGTAIGLPAADYAALDAFAAANGLTIASIPEPASAAIVLLGAGALLRRWRSRRNSSLPQM
jgi:fibronectin-binding autotransporter adhesin